MKVPTGWIHTTFDKHVDCLTGFAFKSGGYSSDEKDIRLLRGDNIEPGNLRWQDARYWLDAADANLERYRLHEGDFVIALDRTWISAGLKVAEVTQADLPCLLVQRVARIRAKPTLEQSLLRQYFSGHRFEQYVKSVQTATAVPHISPNDIKEFPVSLPPLFEQKKIAQILSTWDEAITITKKLLANSQQKKKALMQQLLTGKKRLLDKHGVRFSGEWETNPLAKLGEVVGGLTYSPSDVTDENGTLVLRSSNIQKGLLCFEDNVYVSCTVPKKSVTRENDILLCVRNGSRSLIGKCVLLHGKGVGCFHGAFMSIFRASEPLFIYQIFQSNLFYREVRKNLGATINSINGSDLKKFTFKIPSEKDEREKIAAVLCTADQEITALQQTLNSLKQEKKSLMQQLLTGKRRVKLYSPLEV